MRVLERNRRHHEQNLQTIQPRIDTRDPRRPRGANSKATRLEDERAAAILHENTLLLRKLSNILQRDGSVDTAAPKVYPGQYSMNDAQRRHRIERIDNENQALLKRLQYMKPTIDVDAFQQHWAQHAVFAARTRTLANPLLMAPRTRPRPVSAPVRHAGGHS